MAKTIWNEGRVQGYSAYELFKQKAELLGVDPVPSQDEWSQASLALGTSLLVYLPGGTGTGADNNAVTATLTGCDLRASDQVLVTFFNGTGASPVGTGIQYSTSVADYGNLDNTPPAAMEANLKSRIDDYNKIIDALWIQDEPWTSNDPKIVLRIDGVIQSQSGIWILITGLTPMSVLQVEYADTIQHITDLSPYSNTNGSLTTTSPYWDGSIGTCKVVPLSSSYEYSLGITANSSTRAIIAAAVSFSDTDGPVFSNDDDWYKPKQLSSSSSRHYTLPSDALYLIVDTRVKHGSTTIDATPAAFDLYYNSGQSLGLTSLPEKFKMQMCSIGAGSASTATADTLQQYHFNLYANDQKFDANINGDKIRPVYYTGSQALAQRQPGYGILGDVKLDFIGDRQIYSNKFTEDDYTIVATTYGAATLTITQSTIYPIGDTYPWTDPRNINTATNQWFQTFGIMDKTNLGELIKFIGNMGSVYKIGSAQSSPEGSFRALQFVGHTTIPGTTSDAGMNGAWLGSPVADCMLNVYLDIEELVRKVQDCKGSSHSGAGDLDDKQIIDVTFSTCNVYIPGIIFGYRDGGQWSAGQPLPNMEATGSLSFVDAGSVTNACFRGEGSVLVADGGVATTRQYDHRARIQAGGYMDIAYNGSVQNIQFTWNVDPTE